MSSLPSEVLEDILQPLDRWTLDNVQFTNRRFLQVIMEHVSGVCLRKVIIARFSAPTESMDGSWHIQIDGPPRREIRKDTTRPFLEFVQALRSSSVFILTIDGIVFTAELVALVLQTPIVADTLHLQGSCAQLTHAQLRQVFMHFSPTCLFLDSCHFRACQISDELLRALLKNRLRCTNFRGIAPVDGGNFCVTDDAVVEFCMQQDVPIGREGDPSRRGPLAELILYEGSFTKDLFKRLVQAGSMSTRTQPLHIEVSPVPVEDEDLRDFSQHVSYLGRGDSRRGHHWKRRVYDFPDEQHRAVGAMHLQIVLHADPDHTLEMIRARRPDRLFH